MQRFKATLPFALGNTAYSWQALPAGTALTALALTTHELVTIDRPETLDRALLTMEQRRWMAYWYDGERIKQEQRNGYQWFGGITQQAGRERITEGWPEGVQLITELAQPLRAQLAQAVSVRRKPEWMEHGSQLNTDRALRGEWDRAWRGTRRRARAGTGIITITFPYSFSALTDPDQLKWCGTAAAALSDVLEEAGWQTRILATAALRSRNRGMLYAIETKAPGQPLSLNALAGVLVSPATYRYFAIGLTALAPESTDEGFGSPIDDPIGVARALTQLGLAEPADVILPKTLDREAALAALAEAVENVNARAEGQLDEAAFEEA